MKYARSILIAISALLLPGALPLAAQLPSNATLLGAYNFRYLGLNTYPVVNGGTSAAQAVSALGTITFDGKGGYTVTGKQYTNTGSGKDTGTTLNLTGTYSVFSNAILSIDNMFAGKDASGNQTVFFGGLGAGNILVGSSTEYYYADLFVAFPAAAASDNVSNATLSGAYHVASMEFPASNMSQVRDTFFDVTADGRGSLGTVTIKGSALNVSSSAAQSQTSTAANYSVTATGSGTITFPAPGGVAASDQLLAGSRTLYVSRDGRFFIGGGETNYDLILGVKALPGSNNQTPLQGIYFTGLLQDDTGGSGIYSSAGSANEVGSNSNQALNGLELAHERANDINYGPYDLTYDNYFLFDGSGMYTDSNSSWAAGASGNVVITGGVGTNYWLGLNVKSFPMSGSGVFLNPQGVVNAANSIPFTTALSGGEFITLYGSGMAGGAATATALPFQTTLGGVQVKISGTRRSDGSAYTDMLPLYYVSPGVISGIVPYTVPSDVSVVTLQVVNNGTASNTTQVYMGQTSPGLFTISQNGIGNGSILHQDNITPVTAGNPAKAGEIVVLFLSGLGAVDQPVAAGAAGPSGPLAKATGTPDIYFLDNSGAFYPSSQSATVDYAGLAPGYAGLYQLNVHIPDNVPKGQTLSIQIGTTDAVNTQATIPIGN